MQESEAIDTGRLAVSMRLHVSPGELLTLGRCVATTAARRFTGGARPVAALTRMTGGPAAATTGVRR
tara:strand:+ start:755 stop:955 length:201 start_codon:yes stop_codon:yes gene_type:complete